MAQMTAAQTAAELQRKKNLGLRPTNAANQGAYDKLTANTAPSNGQMHATTATTPLVGPTLGGSRPNVPVIAPKVNPTTAGDPNRLLQGAYPQYGADGSITSINQGFNPATDTMSNPPTFNNVGTAQPTAMMQAMKELPAYVPPASTGINFNDATTQVKGQLDPMFQRAMDALIAQKHQDQLDGDQLGMARGGSHSGLAADLQNKVAIASAGKGADLDATRQTQTAQMAQDLVNRGQDNDFRNQQQKLAEYLGINGLNLQSQNQNFQQGVQNADLTGWYQGLQTLAGQQQSYNQSPTNPNNIGQNLSNAGQALTNQLSELKLGNYSNEVKQQATLYEQQVKSGQMSNEAAAYNLAQLKDPNSAKNQADKIDLQLKQLDLKNAPEEARLKLQQLQKEIAQIGVVHYKPQTAAEIAQDKVTLATANKQLADIANGKYPGDKSAAAVTPTTSEEYQKNLKPQFDNHGKLTNAQQIEDQIILSGMSEYEQYKSYIANGIPWTDPIPKKTS